MIQPRGSIFGGVPKALLLGLICCGTAVAQSGSSFFSCVEEFTVPRYPPLATQVMIEGDVHVVIQLRGDENPEIGFGDGGHPMFKQVLEKRLLQARFSDGCKGQTISLVVRFRLDREAPPQYRDPGATTLKPPDGLEIRASAPPPNHHLEKKRSR